MFDWYKSDYEEERSVLEAEHQFVRNCYGIESDRICYLSGYCSCRDYRLWRGLVYLGRGNYEQAVRDFQYVIDQGMPHWRVYFYQLYSLLKEGRQKNQNGFLNELESKISRHLDLLDELYPGVSSELRPILSVPKVDG
jgi:hypothetical protein